MCTSLTLLLRYSLVLLLTPLLHPPRSRHAFCTQGKITIPVVTTSYEDGVPLIQQLQALATAGTPDTIKGTFAEDCKVQARPMNNNGHDQTIVLL